MEARSTQRPVRVFISYAHGSAEHMEQVRDLWLFLRKQGIDAKLDMPAAEVPQDWALWMIDQVRNADYVLVIASEAYRRRADGLAPPEESRGVVFESGLVREAMYADPVAARRKFLPVVLGDGRLEDIPSFLGQTSTTHYRIAALTEKHAEPLLRVLTGQPLVSEPDLGPPPTLNGLQTAAHPLARFVNASTTGSANVDRRNGSSAGTANATVGSNGRSGGRAPAESRAAGSAATGDDIRDRVAPAGASRRLAISDLGSLVDLLLAVPEVAGPAQWQRLLDLLPGHVAQAVPRQPAGRMEAIALLRTAEQYPGAWPAVVGALWLLAPLSPAVQRFAAEVQRLGLDAD
jgi:hypothetical protein